MAGAYGAAMKAEADALGVACLDLHSAMLGVDGGEETWSVYLGAKDLKVQTRRNLTRLVRLNLVMQFRLFSVDVVKTPEDRIFLSLSIDQRDLAVFFNQTSLTKIS
jgi:hypothetical protein